MKNILCNRFIRIILFILVGLVIGGFIGFLTRETLPWCNKLDFKTVILRGSNIKNQDDFVSIAIAQKNFNKMLMYSIVGGVIGFFLDFIYFIASNIKKSQ